MPGEEGDGRRLAVRGNDYLPPRFSGSDGKSAQNHFLLYEDYLEVQGITPPPPNPPPGTVNQQVNCFKLTLRDNARKWYSGKTFNNLADLKEQFIARFEVKPTRDQDLDALIKATIKPSESYEEFADRLQEIATRLNFDNIIVVEYFGKGLPSKMREFVAGQNPTTLQAAVAAARRYDNLHGETRVCEQVKEVNFSVKEESLELKALRQELDSIKSNMKRPDTPKPRRRSDSRGRRYSRSSSRENRYSRDQSRSPGRQNDSAYSRSSRQYSRNNRDSRRTRYSTSRSASRDRQYRPRDRSQGKDIICWKCDKRGHISRNCESKSADLMHSLAQLLDTHRNQQSTSTHGVSVHTNPATPSDGINCMHSCCNNVKNQNFH